MACTCVAVAPFWFEHRCKECVDEELREWAEAMERVPEIIKRITDERNQNGDS